MAVCIGAATSHSCCRFTSRRLLNCYVTLLLMLFCTSYQQGRVGGVYGSSRANQTSTTAAGAGQSRHPLLTFARHYPVDCITTSGCLHLRPDARRLLQCIRDRCTPSAATWPSSSSSASSSSSSDVHSHVSASVAAEELNNQPIQQSGGGGSGATRRQKFDRLRACIESKCDVRLGAGEGDGGGRGWKKRPAIKDFRCVYESCVRRSGIRNGWKPEAEMDADDRDGSVRPSLNEFDVQLTTRYDERHDHSAQSPRPSGTGTPVAGAPPPAPAPSSVLRRPPEPPAGAGGRGGSDGRGDGGGGGGRSSSTTATKKRKRGGFVDTTSMCINYHCSGLHRGSLGFLRCIGEHRCAFGRRRR